MPLWRSVSTDVPAEVAGRAVLCRRLDMFPVECVARGFLTGGLRDVAGRIWLRLLLVNVTVVLVPVADADRAKDFYEQLGWRLDADLDTADIRMVQFTPPGSECRPEMLWTASLRLSSSRLPQA